MTKTRREDLFLQLPKGAVCVEVGTRFGDLAEGVLTARPDLKLTVVDSWEGQFAEAEATARQRLGRATIVKARSVDAAKQFEDGSLDLVYIDAAHDYNNVLADVLSWMPKVKKGGILAGHDYENKLDGDAFWGPIEVKRAVDAVFAKVNVIEESCPSWWVTL